MNPLRGLLLLVIFSSNPLYSQPDSALIDDIYSVLVIDSLTIQAPPAELDIKYFIDQTVHDTTFYKAFRNLRSSSYQFRSELYFYDKNFNPKTYLRSERVQYFDHNYRSNKIISEQFDKKFYKGNGDYRYFTAAMYDRLFFTNGKVKVDTAISKLEYSDPDSKMESYINELKKLVFQPGREIDIPFIGHKFSVFDSDLKKHYNFYLKTDTITFPFPAYIFEVTVKPDSPEKATAVKSLKTYFKKDNFQILGRRIQLAYKTLIYSFDVEMNIETIKYENKYYPGQINYTGSWNIPFKSSENCEFSFNIVRFLGD